MVLDQFGRNINYLRISLTDHCNLRCVYCMPLDGLSYAKPDSLLTAEQIARVARAAAGIGFRKFRLTGGEPTLRPDLVEVVERLSAIEGAEDLSMTTNGILLPRLAGPLRRAGLRRVNIHLDTLQPERLVRLMRFGSVDRIRAGIDAAIEAGLTPIKLNCVVTGGYNDEDVVELAALTLEHDWHVRFIELMPLGNGPCASVAREKYVATQRTRKRIEAALGPLSPIPPSSPWEESRNYQLPGASGIVGFISPVSEPYCGTCNRMRLTADGRLHLCLLRDDELDVGPLLRRGAAIHEIEDALRKAVQAKPMGHRLEEGVSIEKRSMFQIGG